MFSHTCIDKTSKNFAVICKQYYIECILDEVGFQNNGNDTYEISQLGKNDIVEMLRKDSLKFNINSSDECLTLPFMQITPKMHKNPIGLRTIIASKRCVTKQLSQDIGKCLKLILYNLTKYCDTIHRCTGIQPNWIISNNKSVLDTLHCLGKSNRLKRVDTYDFEKLYTNLELDEILHALDYVIKLGFGYNKRFVTIGKYRANWSTGKINCNTYTDLEIIQMIKLLIENSYFTVGNKVFRQKVGIPMGTDCAPYIANLFLFSYEYKYVMNLIKTGNFVEVMKLRHMYRYIDDITSINDDGYMSDNYGKIYPSSLNLKKVNVTPKKADVLDISIKVNDNFTCSTSVFDKRDEFEFDIVCFPNLRGNVNVSMAINVYKEELRRYQRISSSYVAFRDKTQLLLEKLKLLGYSKNLLKIGLMKILHENTFFDIPDPRAIEDFVF